MVNAVGNAQQESIQISFAKGTDIGRSRDHNEDYVDAFTPPDPAQRLKKGDLFIVADGMGGHQAGEVASEGAVRVISQEYYADPDPDVRSSLIRAIKKANTSIHQQAQQVASRAGMGTTVVIAVVRGRELYLGNVGDSRAYLMRQGQIRQVTQDHSFVAEQIRAGILTPEEARTHPQRNVITRALGSKPDVKVDTYSGELRPGDTLLLCSDGLSEHVQKEDMQEKLIQHPPEEAVPRLIALANKRGGSDNISVLVVRAAGPVGVSARQPAAPAARPAARPGRKGLPLPWIVIGIAAIALIAVMAVGFGAIVAPKFLRKTETLTPTATPPPAPTATATPQPSSTPRFTETPEQRSVEPTVTPATQFSLQEPGEQVLPGIVQFDWQWIGELPASFSFLVNSDQGELCRSDQEQSCTGTLSVGVYKWWVELWGGETLIASSDPHTLTVRTPPTKVPIPTLTPILPTEVPQQPEPQPGPSEQEPEKPKPTESPPEQPTEPPPEEPTEPPSEPEKPPPEPPPEPPS